MNNDGFSLPEMLIALAIGSVLMLGAARLLPLLQLNNLRSLMLFQLHEEMQQMMAMLEKSVRRAGYCQGECKGEGLKISGAAGNCLLVRWDENSNGKWEAAARDDSDYYGYRLRDGNLEMQRGVTVCEGGGWEKLNDPASVVIETFQIIRQAGQLRIALKGFARSYPLHPVRIESWVTAVNL